MERIFFYESPFVEVIEVYVENGFASSGNGGTSTPNYDQEGW